MLEPHEEARLREIQSRLRELGEEPSAPEFSLGDRAAQFGHGMATGTVGMADLLSKAGQYAYKVPMSAAALIAEGKPSLEQKRLGALAEVEREPESHFREDTSHLLNELYGKNLEPTEEDTSGRFIHGAGEFAAPFPGSGYVKAAKVAGKSIPALAKGLGKVGGQELARGAGSSAAMMIPQISEEGSLAGLGENMLKGVLGARAGQKVLSPEALKAVVTAPKKAFTELPARAMSWGTEPNKEVFGLAEKHGVELPSNVGMGGKGGTIQNWLHNNFLKSIFVSKQYKDTIQKADQSMIDAVKHNIDTLGTSQLKPSEASGDYQRLLREQEKEAEQVAGSLYDKASALLSPKDKVVPRNTLDSLESMRELVDRDIKSPATKKVVKILADLSESWGINPQEMGFKDYKSLQAALKNDPKMGTIILDAMGRKPTPISIERLNGVRKELGTITGHDPDIKGVEAYLNRLKGDITKDIESSTNQEFVGAWKEANKFFKQNVADRFRTDMARSLMTGEMPKDAFSLMSNSKTIRELERIAGESPKSKEVFDSLKKSKVQEIFAGALQGEEKLGVGNFINLFKTGKQKETLAALLPHQSYNNMIELRKIAQEYQKSGRDLLNTSGTAWVTADVNRVETLAKAGLAAFFGSSAAGLPGALIAPATPILLSRMVSNPEIVKKARAYALARMNGNEKGADNIMKQLLKMSEKDAKAALVAAQQSTKEKEE